MGGIDEINANQKELVEELKFAKQQKREIVLNWTSLL